MRKLATEFFKVIFDKVLWLIATLFIMALTFGANLNSRVDALESKDVLNEQKAEAQFKVLNEKFDRSDAKLSKILCYKMKYLTECR